MKVIYSLVVLADMIVSVQTILSCLLPADMGAPASVPTLVHSSTSVTVNLYSLIRCRILFNNWLNVIILLRSQ
jgi:NADH:ubiquinone oxidoreductase subunit 5 (subunit L)/multisubunit Na+/H+ antiporter MnhA subunit